MTQLALDEGNVKPLGDRRGRGREISLVAEPRNVTDLVDALERDGYVTREPHPTDRRATWSPLRNAERQSRLTVSEC